MIKNSKLLEKFEEDLIKGKKANFKENLRIADALYKEARRLKVLPLKNPLDGIETVIKIARVINSV